MESDVTLGASEALETNATGHAGHVSICGSVDDPRSKSAGDLSAHFGCIFVALGPLATWMHALRFPLQTQDTFTTRTINTRGISLDCAVFRQKTRSLPASGSSFSSVFSAIVFTIFCRTSMSAFGIAKASQRLWSRHRF